LPAFAFFDFLFRKDGISHYIDAASIVKEKKGAVFCKGNIVLAMELLVFGEIKIVKLSSEKPEDFSGFTVNFEDTVKVAVGADEIVVLRVNGNGVKV
ncbi:hypothetical protein RFZ45_20920, partial [Acinetobacter baumannii]|nr:hypothetical protein [Acinetobacter baumannii]